MTEPGRVLARRVTLSGPPEHLDDRRVDTAASLFRHFTRQEGHLGGHVLVDRESGCFSATSFWDSRADLDRTMERVESSAARMCELMWGDRGGWKIEVFDVIGLSPASRSVELPDL